MRHRHASACARQVLRDVSTRGISPEKPNGPSGPPPHAAARRRKASLPAAPNTTASAFPPPHLLSEEKDSDWRTGAEWLKAWEGSGMHHTEACTPRRMCARQWVSAGTINAAGCTSTNRSAAHPTFPQPVQYSRDTFLWWLCAQGVDDLFSAICYGGKDTPVITQAKAKQFLEVSF